MTNKPIQSVEEAMGAVERILWKYYKPGFSPNMEEQAGQIINVFSSLLEHILDEIEKEHYCDNHEMCTEGCCNSHCCDDERLRIVTILTSAITGKKE